MSRVPCNVLPRVCAQVLSAVLVVVCLARPAQAQTTLEDRDYDLVSRQWAIPLLPDGRPMGPVSVGSLPQQLPRTVWLPPVVLATVLNHQVTGATPWFPVVLRDGRSAFDFNPRYLDLYFQFGLAGFGTGWGYKSGLAPETCGVVPLVMGLQSVGHFGGQPVGVNSVAVMGFGQNVKAIINQNLNAGRPTIAMITRGGNPTDDANHAVLIAGWDKDAEDGAGAYRFLDPAEPRTGWGGYPTLPRVKFLPPPSGTGPATYQNYVGRIKGILQITARRRRNQAGYPVRR